MAHYVTNSSHYLNDIKANVRSQTLRKLKLRRSKPYHFRRLNSSVLLHQLNTEENGFQSVMREARCGNYWGVVGHVNKILTSKQKEITHIN